MRDADRAVFVARTALTSPYQQTELLTTRDFVDWLKDRGIDMRWESLHRLCTPGF